jgi:hypothetical protein
MNVEQSAGAHPTTTSDQAMTDTEPSVCQICPPQDCQSARSPAMARAVVVRCGAVDDPGDDYAGEEGHRPHSDNDEGPATRRPRQGDGHGVGTCLHAPSPVVSGAAVELPHLCGSRRMPASASGANRSVSRSDPKPQ